jgi:hypothetical protein
MAGEAFLDAFRGLLGSGVPGGENVIADDCGANEANVCLGGAGLLILQGEFDEIGGQVGRQGAPERRCCPPDPQEFDKNKNAGGKGEQDEQLSSRGIR